MLALAVLALASPSVRPEPVEGLLPARAAEGASTSSARTEGASALDAERAFAADAQTLGQWTAFRKWAARDATMFVPQPINAQAWLKDRKDPAKAIDWWPTASYVSCDGSLAVNTGGWKRPDGAVGYFSTVWQRQPDGGWKWIVDGGDDLTVARQKPPEIKAAKAACSGRPTQDPILSSEDSGGGRAPDRTLGWMWQTAPDGSRSFWAAIWTGDSWNAVIDDKIAAPK